MQAWALHPLAVLECVRGFLYVLLVRVDSSSVPRLAIHPVRPVLPSPRTEGPLEGLARPLWPSHPAQRSPTARANTPTIYWPFEITDGLTQSQRLPAASEPHRILLPAGNQPWLLPIVRGRSLFRGGGVCECLSAHSRMGAGCSMGISPTPCPLGAQGSPTMAHCPG